MQAGSPPSERDLLASAVREAGALALKTFRGTVKQWTKGQSSPVSEADIAVDALLHDRLARAFPSYGWLSEETEDDPRRLQAEAVWIVDPIDGTRSYLDGREDWVVSVALAVAGRPRLAALYAPVTDEFFFAVAGEGATRNGVPIAVRPGEGLEGTKLLGPKKFLGKLAELHPSVVALPAHRLAGAAAGPHRPWRGRHRRGRRQQPRLGPCGSRPFGARSRRRADRSRRRATHI